MPKVLVVEDDQKLLRLYTAYLESNKYIVKTAADGDEALDIITDFNPDIVLLDIMLPNMSGTEILWTLKADPKYKHIPIIMITGSKDSLKECFEFGAAGYIMKGSGTTTEILKWVKLLVG